MKPATLLSAGFLVLVAVLHALRLILQIEVVVNGAPLPMWASVIAILVPLTLAVGLWREHTAPHQGAV